MEIDKLTIFSATQKKSPEETSLYKSIMQLNMDVDLHFFLDNKLPLAVLYNKALQHARDENLNNLLLIHDDVWLEHDPQPKLERLFDEFDVVGVAGCSKAEIKSPALWHLMGGGFDSGNLHGCVQHYGYDRNPDWDSNAKLIKQPSNFGKFPHRVVMIDGVFMAMNQNYIQNGDGFDEECPSSYHMYDIIQSLQAHYDGFKVGVGDILITHESPGLREFSDDWQRGNDYFILKYGN
jgi:Glycosyltransferase like family